jgi:uncharacterized protein (TIGR00255 family)
VQRGKVELSVQLTRLEDLPSRIRVNREQAEAVLAEARGLQDALGLVGELQIADMLRLPGVVRLETEEPDLEEEGVAAVLRAVDAAMDELERTKQEEGAALAADLRNRVERLFEGLEAIRNLATEVSRQLLVRIRERVQELNRELRLDEERLMQEVAFYADRSDVTEETVRLESHLRAFRETLENGSPAGRRLEFLIQEINREVNTTGSKVRIPELSGLVISMKSELEKIREQVLNLE